jgi:hypothetical protein
MKYSDDTDEHRKANIDYVNQRWKQLQGLGLDFSSEGIKYLLLVNSGAAVAVLAFHGSVAAVRDMVWPKIMLGSFVMGVVFVGLLHIARHMGVSSLFKNWQSLVNEYFTDDRDWNDIVNDDVAKSKKFDWVVYLAYASFACFVIGAAIGMFKFSTLTSGENHVGKEAITSAAAKSNDTTATAIDQHNKGQRAEAFSDAEHASTPTNAKEKVTSNHTIPASGVKAR